jgi:hypothetical protein
VKKKRPLKAASRFLLIAISVAMMVVARIVGIVAMMVAVVAMMVAVAIPGCGWDHAADCHCADNA